METFLLKPISYKADKSCPHFLLSLASSVISKWSPASPHSVSLANCYSFPVCTALNHHILKFRSGRGNQQMIGIWDKGSQEQDHLFWSVGLWDSQHMHCYDPAHHHQWPKYHIISTLQETYSHLLCMAYIFTPSKSFDLTASLQLLARWLACLLACFYCDCQMNASKHFSWSLS